MTALNVDVDISELQDLLPRTTFAVEWEWRNMEGMSLVGVGIDAAPPTFFVRVSVLDQADGG